MQILTSDINKFFCRNIFSIRGVFWAKYFCSKFKLVTENFVNSFEEKKTNLETEYRPKIPLFIDLMPILTPIILMSVVPYMIRIKAKLENFSI